LPVFRSLLQAARSSAGHTNSNNNNTHNARRERRSVSDRCYTAHKRWSELERIYVCSGNRAVLCAHDTVSKARLTVIV
jgi:hypothetical protein